MRGGVRTDRIGDSHEHQVQVRQEACNQARREGIAQAHQAVGERRPLRQVRREIWALRRYDRKNPSSVSRALRDHVLYGENSKYHREVGPAEARIIGPRRLLRSGECPTVPGPLR